MREIKIQALNKNGEDAIQKALGEDSKASLIEKLIFNRMKYKKVIICKDPLIVVIMVMDKNIQRLLNPKDFSQMITNRLVEHGAKEGDFSLEVIE